MMNQTLIDLAVRAGGCLTPTKEEFGVLVVKECISRIWLQSRMDEVTDKSVYVNLMAELESHFGIKR